MRIKWVHTTEGILVDHQDSDIIVEEFDSPSVYKKIPLCLRRCLEENSSSFTKEELEFLNSLIDSGDKDNLLMCFHIIDKR